MAINVSFFIGLNDQDTKTQIVSTLDAETIITKCIVKYFEFGATLTNCKGIYKHNDGTNTIVIESSFRVDVLFLDYSDNDAQRCNRFTNVVKRVFNQESILIVSSSVSASFI